MKDEAKTKKQLIAELVELRQRFAELEAVEIERKRAQETLHQAEQDSIRQMKIAYEQAIIYAQELNEEIAQRKRTQTELARRAQAMEALYETSLEINAQPNLSRLLHAIVQRAAKLLGMRRGGLFLMRPDGESLELVAGYNQHSDRLGTVFRLGEGLTGRVAQSGEPLMVADYEHWPSRVDTFNLDPVGRILGVPLKQGKQVIGVLNVFDDENTGEFDEEAIRLLSLFAAQATIALENARLFEAERQRQEELVRSNALIRALSRVATRLQANLDPGQVMETLGVELKQLDLTCLVAALDPDTQELVVEYSSVEAKSLTLAERLTRLKMQGFRLTSERFPIYANLIEHGYPTYLSDAMPVAAALVHGLPRPIVTQVLRSVGVLSGTPAMWLPLVVEERMLGTLAVWGEGLQEVDLPALSIFASQVATALENARLFKQVQTGRERLETLSRRLVEVQESEHRFIARELHDEIGQALTGLKLLLEMVAKFSTDTDEGRTRLSRAQALVDQIMVQVRDLSLGLRPPMLDDLGILPTLLWYFERYTAQTGIEVAFKHRGVKGRRFAAAVETAAYRIVQEALTNVARHANVQEATVRVLAFAKTFQVQITDRGAGFDPAAINSDGRNGLSGMQERAGLLGGQLEVESTIGIGTQVMADLPLVEQSNLTERKT